MKILTKNYPDLVALKNIHGVGIFIFPSIFERIFFVKKEHPERYR